MTRSRREFINQIGMLSAGLGLSTLFNSDLFAQPSQKKLFFEISLAEWSLHKSLTTGKMTNLDFPVRAKKEFGINVVEYVDQFFKDKANDKTYLKELLKISTDNGVKNHLIMIDTAGHLADTDKVKRNIAVENHYKWVEAAKFLGCSTIRVNAAGEGTAEEVKKAAVEGLHKLSEFGAKHNINVIVENHGGYSSNGEWLVSVMKGVNLKNCGTLPDFGNFCMHTDENWKCDSVYDLYKGTEELIPYAKGVSAKTFNFDENGNEKDMDYVKLLTIIKKSGFKGYFGIEYEGKGLSEEEGIKKTKALLEKVGAML